MSSGATVFGLEVPAFRILAAADARLDDIARHSAELWGREQAARYLEALFAEFGAIAQRERVWIAIPAERGIDGF